MNISHIHINHIYNNYTQFVCICLSIHYMCKEKHHITMSINENVYLHICISFNALLKSSVLKISITNLKKESSYWINSNHVLLN